MIKINIDLKQAKILAIDDEIINLQILQDLLESNGYQHIDCATSPSKAINLYCNHDYDLILLDLNMPEIDGFGVLQAFRKIDRSLPPPVLVLTALSDKATELNCLKQGVRDFLTKPFNSDEVLYRVANLLELHISQKMLSRSNSELEERVKRRTRDLEAARVEVVQRLAMAADYRDTETSEHTIRVGHITRVLALAKGLDTDYSEVLFSAAPMHDIGKIGIPDSILLKPGSLTDDEMQQMKQHTLMGARILENSPSEVLNEARIIAESHHERWDGTGYPHGLKETEIPLAGRLVILADVFDALTSARPYKEPWTFDAAIAFIQEQKGKMFDPELVDLMIANMDEILKVKLEFNDK